MATSVTGRVKRIAFFPATDADPVAELIVEIRVRVGLFFPLRTFKAYGSSAYRLCNYIIAGKFYTLDYIEDTHSDEDESEGEIISAHER